jgi:hypothetical protein
MEDNQFVDIIALSPGFGITNAASIAISPGFPSASSSKISRCTFIRNMLFLVFGVNDLPSLDRTAVRKMRDFALASNAPLLGEGGAISAYLSEGVQLVISDSIFEDNRARVAGAITQSSSLPGTLVIRNCTFLRQQAEDLAAVIKSDATNIDWDGIILDSNSFRSMSSNRPNLGSCIDISAAPSIKLRRIKSITSERDLSRLAVQLQLSATELAIDDISFSNMILQDARAGSLLSITAIISPLSPTIVSLANFDAKDIFLPVNIDQGRRVQNSLVFIAPTGPMQLKDQVTISNMSFSYSPTGDETGAIPALFLQGCFGRISNLSLTNYHPTLTQAYPSLVSILSSPLFSISGFRLLNVTGGLFITGGGLLEITDTILNDVTCGSTSAIQISDWTRWLTIVNLTAIGVKNGASLEIRSGSEASISSSSFRDNNRPSDSGSGLRALNVRDINIKSSEFLNNQATSGAAIFAWDVPTFCITDTVFNHNMAISGGGGAININGETLKMNRVSMSGNSAMYGGAVDISLGLLSLVDSNFTSNKAIAGSGGVISVTPVATMMPKDLVLSIDGCLFVGNSASQSGGAISAFSTGTGAWDLSMVAFELEILNTKAMDNVAGLFAPLNVLDTVLRPPQPSGDHISAASEVPSSSSAGGFIHTPHPTSMHISDSDLSWNQAEFGGAIFIDRTKNASPGPLNFVNTSMAYNRAQVAGGALWMHLPNRSTQSFVRLSGHFNSAPWGGFCFLSGAPTSAFASDASSSPNISNNWTRNVAYYGSIIAYANAPDFIDRELNFSKQSFVENEAAVGSIILYEQLSKTSSDLSSPHDPCSKQNFCYANTADNGLGRVTLHTRLLLSGVPKAIVRAGNREFVKRVDYQDLHLGMLQTFNETRTLVGTSEDGSDFSNPVSLPTETTTTYILPPVYSVLTELSGWLVDDFGKRYQDKKVHSISMSMPHLSGASLSNLFSSSIVNGRINIKFLIYASPGQPAVDVSITFASFNADSIKLNTSVGGCPIGHGYSETQGCVYCDIGSYSYDNSGSCRSCVDHHAQCREGRVISDEGYYAYIAYPDYMQASTANCPRGYCLGDNRCSTGRIGFICGSCREPLNQSWTSNCSKCDGPNISLLVLILIGLWIITIGLHMLVAKSSGKSTILLYFVQTAWLVVKEMSFVPLLSSISGKEPEEAKTTRENPFITWVLCLYPMNGITRQLMFAMVPFIMATQLTITFLAHRLFIALRHRLRFGGEAAGFVPLNYGSEGKSRSKRSNGPFQASSSFEEDESRATTAPENGSCQTASMRTVSTDGDETLDTIQHLNDSTFSDSETESWVQIESLNVDIYAEDPISEDPYRSLSSQGALDSTTSKDALNYTRLKSPEEEVYDKVQFLGRSRFFHWDRYQRTLFSLFAQSYSAVSGLVMVFTDCTSSEGTGFYMFHDPDILCTGSYFKKWQLSMLFTVPWMLFVIVAISVRIFGGKKNGTLYKYDIRFGVWYEMFKSKWFFFKLWELLRRTIIGFPLFYGSNPVNRGSTLAFLLIIYLSIQLLTQPYIQRIENLLASISAGALVILALLTTMNPYSSPRLEVITVAIAVTIIILVVLLILSAFAVVTFKTKIIPALKRIFPWLDTVPHPPRMEEASLDHRRPINEVS